jgi:DNA-binding response OmpR family regulator
MQVLIVAPHIPSSTVGEFEQRGMSITTVEDVDSGRARLESMSFDLLVLDLRLPERSGLELLCSLRRAGSTMHVIVTSGAAREETRVRVLDLGADDFVAEPFSARELAARAAAVERRRDDRRAQMRFGHVEIRAPRGVDAEGVRLDGLSRRAIRARVQPRRPSPIGLAVVARVAEHRHRH